MVAVRIYMVLVGLIFFVGGTLPVPLYPINTANVLNYLSPYYLVKKGNLCWLVNIKNWVLEMVELPSNINGKKFTYDGNIFKKSNKINISK
jgi:hypothetical protein